MSGGRGGGGHGITARVVAPSEGEEVDVERGRDGPGKGGAWCWSSILCSTSARLTYQGKPAIGGSTVYVRDGGGGGGGEGGGGLLLPVEEDDLILTVRSALFFSSSPWRQCVFWGLSVLSLGLLYVVLGWTPLLQARIRFAPATGAQDADYVVVQGLDGTWSLLPLFVVTAKDCATQWTPAAELPPRRRRQAGAAATDSSGSGSHHKGSSWWWYYYSTVLWLLLPAGAMEEEERRGREEGLPLLGHKKAGAGDEGAAGGGVEASLLMFEWRQERFWHDPLQDAWYRVQYRQRGLRYSDLHEAAVTSLHMHATDPTSQARRIRTYGLNRIEVPRHSLGELLLIEMSTPFFLFQVFSVTLWLVEAYYVYTAILFLLTMAAITMSALATQKNQRQLERIATYETQVKVLRGVVGGGSGATMTFESATISSADLLPGDIVQVIAGLVCPSDLLLLTGVVIVNESTLTGESAPVPKEALPVRSDKTFARGGGQGEEGGGAASSGSSAATSKHVLLGGSKIMQVKPPQAVPFEAAAANDSSSSSSSSSSTTSTPQQPSLWNVGAALPAQQQHQEGVCLALVLDTSFSTAKGKLVRGILFPQVKTRAAQKRERDVYLYLLGLVLVLSPCIVWYAVYSTDSRFVVVVRCLDIITILVPPALPLALTIGTGVAAQRLAKAHIYSTSPAHIASAGTVDTVCYDKTGTLTLANDNVAGVLPPQQQPQGGGPLLRRELVGTPQALLLLLQGEEEAAPPPSSSSYYCPELALLDVLCACHSLSTLHDHDGDDDRHHTRQQPQGTMTSPPPPSSPPAPPGGGVGGLVGDPLEIAMVNFSQARIITRPPPPPTATAGGSSPSWWWQDPRLPAFVETLILLPTSVASSSPSCLAILRQLEFDPNARLMSVLALRLVGGYPQHHGKQQAAPPPRLVLLTKGAPESVARLCETPSLPTDLQARLQEVTLGGGRVLGCAYRDLSSGMTMEAAMAAPRASLEARGAGMRFCGLLVVGNELKPTTKRTLGRVGAAGLKQAMVTGDNGLTALSVAKQCGPNVFAHPRLPSLLLDAASGEGGGGGGRQQELTLMRVEAGQVVANVQEELGEAPASSSPTNADTTATSVRARVPWEKYNLVVTGAAFSLVSSREEQQEQQEQEGGGEQGNSSSSPASPAPLFIRRAEILRYAGVFARFNPKEKQQVIRAYQLLGRSVAMIGDGANDSFALKAADAGISINAHTHQTNNATAGDSGSHAEGEEEEEEVDPDDREAAVPSIAAQFSTPLDDISALEVLLCEGRGALAAAMVAFRYMLDYGFIQFTAVMILYVRGVDLGDAQFLWGDFFNVLVLLILLDLTPANRQLLTPGLPEADLLDLRGFLGGNIFHVILIVGSQVAMHLITLDQPFFSDGKYTTEEYDQTSSFHCSSLQYVITAMALSHDYGGFRESALVANRPLIAGIVVLLAANVVLFLWHDKTLEDLLGIVPFPLDFSFLILLYATILTAAFLLLEFGILKHVNLIKPLTTTTTTTTTSSPRQQG